mgnify:CR=1 FL=1
MDVKSLRLKYRKKSLSEDTETIRNFVVQILTEEDQVALEIFKDWFKERVDENKITDAYRGWLSRVGVPEGVGDVDALFGAFEYDLRKIKNRDFINLQESELSSIVDSWAESYARVFVRLLIRLQQN